MVSHNGSENTRVFQDVREVGEFLNHSLVLKNTITKSEVALIFDWDSRIALLEQKSLKNKKKDFDSIIVEHYEALIKQYVSVDIISQEWDFSKYKLIVAPVLYLFKENTAEKIRDFVAIGGTVVMTYYSGLVNENDLVFLESPPAGLLDVFGIESEEMDALCDDEHNEVVWNGKEYRAIDYCDLIKAGQGRIMAAYGKDFYKGMPALTENKYHNGNAYYIAFRSDDDFLYDFYKNLIGDLQLKKSVDIEFCSDVMIHVRESVNKKYLFIMNFSTQERKISLPETYHSYRGNIVEGNAVLLKGYEFSVLIEDK